MDIPAKGEADIFTEALNVPAREREAFLNKACGGDKRLRQKVEALLKSHAEVGDFLEEAPDEAVKEARVAATADDKPLDRIGRYKLLRQIGEGGCGVVFMAEQEEPVRRRVALKIIKPGMDTKSVIARFEAERQALALMDHPSIAKVFDAGATDSGRPYFVMELVQGVKITDYCDEHSLTTEERLKLFMQVCAAIQHAHQKGIIHRDIKPSNILVTITSEGVPLPVVIDFGIAKPTANQRLTDKTLFTAFEMFIGTPEYMSPEQASLTVVEVDTRTDIYNLGVLLYELLTGSKPFETTELLKVGIDEIRKVIREQEPARPSTRLSKMKSADLTTVAQRRKSEPPKLIRTIRGDLDWIVMKALEKDRARRYATANALALDVTRFLAHEAVIARPPSKLYRLGKTVQRNKFLFFGIGLIAMLLMVSLVVVTASLAKERRARREAQTEATKSQQVTKLLEGMLQGVGPSVARGRDTIIIEEILDRTSDLVGTELTNQPAVELELRRVIGRVYWEIGKYDRAQKAHLAELALCRKLFKGDNEETATALYNLGNAYWKDRKLAEAQTGFTEALDIRRRVLGPKSAEVAEALDGLGNVFRRQLRLAESESLIREGLAIREELFGSEGLEVADSFRNLSMVLVDRGEFAEAEELARKMLAIRQRLLGHDHYLVASALTDVAWVLGNNGKREEAERLEIEAFGIRRNNLGDEHPDLAKSIYLFGDRMRQRGNLTESHAVLQAALSIQRKLLGEAHSDTLASLGAFGQLLATEGEWEEAEEVHREALTIWRKKVGDQHPHTLRVWGQLCHVLVGQRKYQQAEQLAAEILTPAFLNDPACADLLGRRMDLMSRQGRWTEAVRDAAILVPLQPAEYYWHFSLAALLATTQDRLAYEQLCRKLPGPFAPTSNPYIAQRIADSCLLLPNSGADMRSVAQLANRAIALGNRDTGIGYFQACKALSDYRESRFSEAVGWAEKARESPEIFARARACAVLAMAQWRLGLHDAARATLSDGEKLVPDISSVSARGSAIDLGDSWINLVLARVQLDEAGALIRPDASPPNNPSKEN